MECHTGSESQYEYDITWHRLSRNNEGPNGQGFASISEHFMSLT